MLSAREGKETCVNQYNQWYVWGGGVLHIGLLNLGDGEVTIVKRKGQNGATYQREPNQYSGQSLNLPNPTSSRNIFYQATPCIF